MTTPYSPKTNIPALSHNFLTDNIFFFQLSRRLDSIQSMNLERQAAVRDFCKRNNRTNDTLDNKRLDNIIVDEKFKILFCYIPKVACTQWKTVMASLDGRETKLSIHDVRNFKFLGEYAKDEIDRMLKTYFKFVFVREPFERLLSAYLDKFNSGDPAFHRNYGREIIIKYRPGGNPEHRNITFDEYLNYVLNIGKGYWNEHWQTYDKLCQPCGIQYDFIGKFENLEQEASYVLEMSGISRKSNVSFPAVKPSTTSSKVPFFYSQISKDRLYGVLQLFGRDTEMFRYNLPKPLHDILDL